ncbi:hypothetical protein CW705_05270 [Candidatus Bathyarchaeota archaeon]|nr:MAG: hypothetical protein CW705_05270 [Candidatus Bathyarchaeota archaeon]
MVPIIRYFSIVKGDAGSRCAEKHKGLRVCKALDHEAEQEERKPKHETHIPRLDQKILRVCWDEPG